jgi:ech hydrogenase subunit D
MQGEVIPVNIHSLIGETGRMKAEGYRFVTMSCTELDESTVDILYHFDRDLTLKHLRLAVPKETMVPSVSPVYLVAFLVENEIQDMFGVRFNGLTVDYNRTLYLDEEIKTTPLCKYSVSRAKKEEAGLKTVEGP